MEKARDWGRFSFKWIMGDSALFENREIAGTLLAWYSNGFLADSSVRMEDGSGVSVGGLITNSYLKV